MFVSGGSAGGYITFQSGHMLTPRPAGLVALYGDVFVGDWYTKAHEADAIVGGARLGDIEQHAGEIEKFFEKGRKPVAGRSFKDGREIHSMFYNYLIRKGECMSCFFPFILYH